jgi:hypothetical protein
MFKASIVPLVVDETGNPFWFDEPARLVAACGDFQVDYASSQKAADLLDEALTAMSYERAPNGEVTQFDLIALVKDKQNQAVSSVVYRRVAPRAVSVGNRTLYVENLGSIESDDGRRSHFVTFACNQPLRGWDFLAWLKSERGHCSLNDEDLDMTGCSQIEISFAGDAKSGFVKMALRWPELFDSSNISRLN